MSTASPRLNVESLRPPASSASPTVALVHGFTQNASCWAPFDRELAAWGSVVAVDLPGHGRSPPARSDLWTTGPAVAHSAPAEVHLGYSLGGRVLLHAALARPTAVRRLVLIGAHPGLERDDERRSRRAEDEARAARLERLGVADFLDEWLALPLFDGLTPATSHRDARLGNDAGALAEALRRLGLGRQEPLWGRLGELDLPVLVVAGERDERFTDLGRRTATAIGARATFAVVPGVGHATHLEDPSRTAALVLGWLESTG